MAFTYNSTEFNKLLVETVEEWGNTVTYIGTARYAIPPYEKTWYAWPDDKAKEIWMIRRELYDPNTWLYDYSYPNLDPGYNYAWTLRATYNYEERPQPTPPVPPTPTVDNAFLMENWDTLISELWAYIVLESA